MVSFMFLISLFGLRDIVERRHCTVYNVWFSKNYIVLAVILSYIGACLQKNTYPTTYGNLTFYKLLLIRSEHMSSSQSNIECQLLLKIEYNGTISKNCNFSTVQCQVVWTELGGSISACHHLDPTALL